MQTSINNARLQVQRTGGEFLNMLKQSLRLGKHCLLQLCVRAVCMVLKRIVACSWPGRLYWFYHACSYVSVEAMHVQRAV
eukprot:10852431-Alexandrium_andersonii.AAC.1